MAIKYVVVQVTTGKRWSFDVEQKAIEFLLSCPDSTYFLKRETVK